MVELVNVSKKYREKILFENVNLKIDKPGLYLIKGNNGVGKTTLLNIIAGLCLCEGKVTNEYKNSMGYLWQNSSLVDHLSLKQHLSLFKIKESALKKLFLEDKLNSYPDSLSDGQRQRVGLIISLCSDNKLVLLDEPISNVDKKIANAIKRMILKNKEKKIIIMVSHNYQMFKDCFDGIITIKDKKVEFQEKNERSCLSKVDNYRLINKDYICSKKRFYFRDHFKFIVFILLFFIILSSLNLSEYIIDKLIIRDSKNNLEYNKYYLKECENILTQGYTISNCYNPSEDNLKKLNVEYGYNYDYILSFLYSRDDLRVISNKSATLNEGKYPSNINEVIASENYKLGDKIILDSNVILGERVIDFYKDNLEVEVVGIYSDLLFKNSNHIYFDYEIVKEYYDTQFLINNNISMNEYYQNLDINQYKYLSFEKEECNIIFENNEEIFYDGIWNVFDKCVVLIDYLKGLLLIMLGYSFFRMNQSLLEKKKREYGYLVSNGFNKRKLVSIDFKIYFVLFSIVAMICVVMLFAGINYIKEMVIGLLLISIILIFQFFSIYFKKDIYLIMRDKND